MTFRRLSRSLHASKHAVTSPEIAVAFIGLGAMGFHMAGHLADKGVTTLVWNRTKTVAESHAAMFPSVPLRSFDELSRAEIVFLCLPTSDVVDAVMLSFLKQPLFSHHLDNVNPSATPALMVLIAGGR